MSNTVKNVETVRSIGKGVRLTETAVPVIVASLPDTFDPAVRGAVATAVHAWANGNDGSTYPAMTVNGKNDDGKTVKMGDTDYGRGHDTLVRAVKTALKGASSDESLRVTRKGIGSVVIPADHDLYEQVMAFLTASKSDNPSA